MSDLKELILEVEAAEKNGQRFTCSYGDSRTAMRATTAVANGSASARWHAAVANEMQHSRCDKRRACAKVVRQNPSLHAQLIAEANGGRNPTSQSTVRSTASSAASTVRKQSPTAQFREEVQRLVDGGMDKLSAIKLLSQRMGLSSNEPSPGFVSTRQQYR